MSPRIVAVSGPVEADTRLLAEVFHTLKAQQVNVRKLDFLQGAAPHQAGYLYMELVMDNDTQPRNSVLEMLRAQLRPITVSEIALRDGLQSHTH